MLTLLEYVNRRRLPVLEHVPGVHTLTEELPEQELAENENTEDLYELDALSFDNTPALTWVGDDPKDLLRQGLTFTALNGSGSGGFKMRLYDRRHGSLYGESVVFLAKVPNDDLESALLFDAASQPDEFEEALFGSGGIEAAGHDRTHAS
jgi:hypothetical protein